MATLNGIARKLTVTHIEAVSDDRSKIMSFERDQNGACVVKVRSPWQSEYDYEGVVKFTIGAGDISSVTSAMNGGDASYNTRVKEIDTDRYHADDVNAAAVEKEVEARCSQLDIERAKAANLKEEAAVQMRTLVIQHLDDKHVRTGVIGCEMCDEAARATTLGSPMPWDTEA